MVEDLKTDVNQDRKTESSAISSSTEDILFNQLFKVDEVLSHLLSYLSKDQSILKMANKQWISELYYWAVQDTIHCANKIDEVYNAYKHIMQQRIMQQKQREQSGLIGSIKNVQVWTQSWWVDEEKLDLIDHKIDNPLLNKIQLRTHLDKWALYDDRDQGTKGCYSTFREIASAIQKKLYYDLQYNNER